jgi:hypothetical protein
VGTVSTAVTTDSRAYITNEKARESCRPICVQHNATRQLCIFIPQHLMHERRIVWPCSPRCDDFCALEHAFVQGRGGDAYSASARACDFSSRVDE